MKNDALEAIYKKYYTELYLYALSLCQSHHQAQDLVSDTFYKAMLSLDDSKDYIKFWLFRVCKNLFLDHTRRDKNLQDIDDYKEILSKGDTPLEQVINDEKRLEIYFEILKLQPSYKEVIILFYYCHFSVNEISKTTGLSESGIKSILFRARRKLKTALKEDCK
ncbi:sigma-70 family RNA polymerase sigma factor [Serpentinicella sp. ANB-PHB4]|uniref:RNA polymerase sigma factor n=1 Tax=Serpentinicella sp. ANB-PHB4 TaxID=3074076 RepID=UPI002858340E|nr:sigma-70 family RNA polymerase sigma factor [Serpentinicella sp. ANB-PHB4]MDR5659975.1 sigma-70 family RNA polymerase sigma factor [Serpentinicella sp. ANB-PHB4]